MAIKNLICHGIGFSPGSVKFIPTFGFSIGVGVSYTAYGVTLPCEDGVARYFEVHMRATAGTSHARLYDVTGTAVVSGSALSTTSATEVRLRTATRLALTDGSEYRAEFGETSDGQKRAARLVRG